MQIKGCYNYSMKQINKTRYLKSYWVWGMAFLAVGLNIGLSALTTYLNWFIYLDCIGTILVSAYCGAIPGILVALLTAGIKGGLWGVENTYYCLITSIMSVIIYSFSKRGWLTKWHGLLIADVIISLFAGFLGGLQSYYFAKFGVSPAPYAFIIYNLIDAGMPLFWAQIL